MKIDIRDNKEVIEIINNVLNNKGIVEIKNESRNPDKPNIVVVEVSRYVKTTKQPKQG